MGDLSNVTDTSPPRNHMERCVALWKKQKAFMDRKRFDYLKNNKKLRGVQNVTSDHSRCRGKD